METFGVTVAADVPFGVNLEDVETTFGAIVTPKVASTSSSTEGDVQRHSYSKGCFHVPFGVELEEMNAIFGAGFAVAAVDEACAAALDVREWRCFLRSTSGHEEFLMNLR